MRSDPSGNENKLKSGAEKAGRSKDRPGKAELRDNSVISLTIIQLALLGVTALAFYHGLSTLGVLFFCSFLLGFTAKVWARLSGKKVYASIEAERHNFFPGDSGTVCFKVENAKGLPIPWVEFSLPIEEPVVIRPDRGISTFDKTSLGLSRFQVRTGRIGSFSENVYDTKWIALRRGVRTLRNMEIFTGDGFGLVNAMIEPEHNSSRDLVVYPKIVGVNISLFTQFQWEGDHHPKGVLEDPTVIKLTRPYQDTDNMKDINWRMLARGRGMTTNRYEHIRPNKCHIIFDGQSFDGDVRHHAELEEALSILASLTLTLDEWGMNTGYSFPKTRKDRPSTIYAEKDNLSEVLYSMAAYELREPVMVSQDNSGHIKYAYEDSLFNDDILTATFNETGRIYFVTFDEESADRSAFLRELNENNVKVLTFAALSGLKI